MPHKYYINNTENRRNIPQGIFAFEGVCIIDFPLPDHTVIWTNLLDAHPGI